MQSPTIKRCVTSRIPTEAGEFQLALYQAEAEDENKEHLALVCGEVAGRRGVAVRIHSECFTGDVLGSRRCDCGDQLHQALEQFAREGRGILLYLRQEGRGIGLLQKLRAYNLQDEGFDTVVANQMLGHAADERDYSVGARILKDLGVESIRLVTNNPAKIAGLVEHGIEISERIAMKVAVKAENADYLKAKARHMQHLFDLSALEAPPPSSSRETDPVPAPIRDFRQRHGRPFVTLSYAQSIDGCIAAQAGKPLALSGPESMALTHRLRAAHDTIVVGIGTVLADDPRLTVRLVEADDPRPVVLDTRLRTPVAARLLAGFPWIISGEDVCPERRERLEEAGAQVFGLPTGASGGIDLEHLLQELGKRGADSLMVEGGARVIRSFLRARLVNHLVLTVAPTLVGGLPAVGRNGSGSVGLSLSEPHYQQLGKDLILWGEPEWAERSMST